MVVVGSRTREIYVTDVVLLSDLKYRPVMAPSLLVVVLLQGLFARL